MPRKASGETYVWDTAKEKKFLKKIDEYLSAPYKSSINGPLSLIPSASGFGSITMRDDSTPYVEHEGSMENSGTRPVLEEELTPSTDERQGNNRRVGDDAGLSRSRGSSGKRKQREATDEMTYSAMQEIMGIPLAHWTIMWHYFEAHPRMQHTFHQLPDDDRREIIASIVKSQSPADD
ncbi:hypothetical protein TIFTF001_027565 [Ficus carica]|uniref:Uncharacterized protein n=1 Tax=Ficus carica TaxID=3494 RepID=A0AA88DNE8_FICCA|nr:hypothetical protein TIFTF001_027565 [Ficus carica]